MLPENPRHLIRDLTNKQFDFSMALTLMKAGYQVYRTGWNGSNMWACIHNGYPEGIPISETTANVTRIEEGTVCIFLPYFLLKTPSPAATFAHWVPSGTDILSNDWMIKL